MPGLPAGKVSAVTKQPLQMRSESCATVDPLEVFAAAGTAPRFFWEQPSAGRYRVGVGTAARLTSAGSGRFRDAGTAAQELFDTIGWEGEGARVAHLLGGFAFAPSQTPGGLWQGFPDGELRLPEVAFWSDGDGSTRVTRAGSAWINLRPRPVALGHPVRGVVEILNGGREAYVEQVQRILGEIRAGRLQKVVLARAVHVTAGADIDPIAWLVALRERFPTCTLFAVGDGPTVFLGASPERLLRAHGQWVETAALAGTAPRGASRTADLALGEALRDSSKNGAEHAVVVQYLRSVLDECCDDVQVAREPVLLRTRTVQHLCTEIKARRRERSPAALMDLVGRMHPTPAVGGAPREAALRWLDQNESTERGWFAGPVGFVQSDGDGEFAVALRSALVRGRNATAWAGAGIVERSQPMAEFTETELKLRTVLGPLLWGAP
jgi:isochorismate synthase